MLGMPTSAFAVLAALVLAGCAGSAGRPQAVSVEDTVESTATIAALDLLKRTVVLKTEDGLLRTIVAGPEIRNLGRIGIGDTVKATYVQGVAARMAEPGADDGAGVTDDALRALKGDPPGAAAGRPVRTVVTIVAYDDANNLVSFAGPDELVRSVVVAKPEMQEFARGLRPGDKVELTFTEARAVGIVQVEGE